MRRTDPPRPRLARCARGLVAALLAATVAQADDRDLLRGAAESPYVFFLLDLSGSMARGARCTAEQLARGECRRSCENGDCRLPLDGDDPASKLYQAKHALHQVLQQVSPAQLGLATFNQDGLRVASKHWLYRSTAPGLRLAGGGTFPPPGAEETFGRTWPCVSGATPADAIGCAAATPASLGDPWSLSRVLRLPKLGDDLASRTSLFVASGGTSYEITYSGLGGALGDTTLRVHVEARPCAADAAGVPTCGPLAGQADVAYALVDSFLAWDSGAQTAAPRQGFFDQASGSDAFASNTCAGWDPNSPPEPASADPFGGYDLRFPTLQDARGDALGVGDVVPLDWQTDHRAEILRRLAPASGDFGQSHYFADHPRPGEEFLRLRDESLRPLVAFGSTPLAAALGSFRAWYSGCAPGTCATEGWRRLAAAQDPAWGCRRKLLVLLTDGDETCGDGASACAVAAALREEGVLTYVLAFGAEESPTLACIAESGGTGRPLFAQDETELVRALTATLEQVGGDPRAFATAAVPSVQADADDMMLLAELAPVAGASTWDGRLDAYLKPLPLGPDGGPDRDRECNATRAAGCHLWDAGALLLRQAPTGAEALAGDLRLGTSTSERRVLYATAGNRLRPLAPPSTSADWLDLFQGLGFRDASDSGRAEANQQRAANILARALAVKESTVPGGRSLRYVLGDIFHSAPVTLEPPHDFDAFAGDIDGNGASCRLGGTNRGYRCFAFQHQHRRRLVIAGANDAQLHAFDAGTFDPVTGRRGNGSGGEAFAYVPRMALPILREQAEGSVHVLGIDGAATVGDLLLGDGRWHTLLVGGLREGGRELGGQMVQQPEMGSAAAEPLRAGFYALDVTQPDPLREELDASGHVRRFLPATAGPVPGCSVLTGSPPAGCPRRFPAPLWEFRDTSPATGLPLDENGNGQADLGAPWSRPVLTRIRLLAGGGVGSATRSVVVIGGGIDPATKASAEPASGNFVYILDAGTGAVLYKRQVEGGVPAVAVLDADRDGVADAIYAGTTAGRLYRIDLRTPAPLEPVLVRDRSGATVAVERVTAAAWAPLLLFRTGEETPIYEQVQILFVARLDRFALVFGTGDREDLWGADARRGRLYVLVDEGLDGGAPGLPLDESSYQQVTPEGAALAGTPDLLLAPASGKRPGWYLLLGPGERVVTKAFGAAGVLTFSTYLPRVTIDADAAGEAGACRRGGSSRSFVVRTSDGDALTSLDGDGLAGRYTVTEDLPSEPFLELAQTRNRPAGDAGGDRRPPSEAERAASCTESPRLQAIAKELAAHGPPGARYGNYFLRLGQRLSQRGVVYPACIPIAITERNWKEN